MISYYVAQNTEFTCDIEIRYSVTFPSLLFSSLRHLQRISSLNRRHSSAIEASAPSLSLRSAARALLSDMRSAYAARAVGRGSADEASDGAGNTNPPSSSSSSTTTAASNMNSSSSSSSSSSKRTPKRHSNANKWRNLDLSASSSPSILTSSYDYDNGDDNGDNNGDDNEGDFSDGSNLMHTSESADAGEGRSNYEGAESETALLDRTGSRDESATGEDAGIVEDDGEGIVIDRNGRNPGLSKALDHSNSPFEEDFGEYIGGSSSVLFSPSQFRSHGSSRNSEIPRNDLSLQKDTSDGIQDPESTHTNSSNLNSIAIEETANEKTHHLLDTDRTAESVIDLYDIGDTDLLELAARSTVKKSKKSKRMFPATPDTADKKGKKRRKSEKDSIDDIFGDI